MIVSDGIRLLLCCMLVFVILACSGRNLIAHGDLKPAQQRILITIAERQPHQASMIKSFNHQYQVRPAYRGSLSVRRELRQIAKDYGLNTIDSWHINSLGVLCGMLSLPEGLSVNNILELLKDDKRVESAQLVYRYQVQGAPKYNDPYLELQYSGANEILRTLHTDATGAGVKIAIIDTGVDIDHPDLKGQIDNIRNFVDKDKNQLPPDIHGTAVAGIIVAKPDNALGIAGLSPAAQVWALKACWQLQRDADNAQCNSFTLASALAYAIDNGVDIINMSLSGPEDPLIARLVQQAVAQHIIVVAADPQIMPNRYPALLPGVIAVTNDLGLAKPSYQADSAVFSINVKGNEVLSTGPSGSFDFFSGVSMSVAIVSASSALVIEKDKNLSNDELIAVLSDSSKIPY